MKPRIEQYMKLTLAIWLGIGVLSAGLLTLLPELHAELHHHHVHTHDGHEHDHGHSEDPVSHTCLAQFFAEGSVEQGATPTELVIGPIFVTLAQLTELQAAIHSDARLLPPGRAPPFV